KKFISKKKRTFLNSQTPINFDFVLFLLSRGGGGGRNHLKKKKKRMKEIMNEIGEKQEHADFNGGFELRIPFNSFLVWWSTAHKGGKRGGRYRKMFKLKQAKLNLMSDFDIDNIITTNVGTKGSAEFRVIFKYQQKNGKIKQISPWHDIPLRHGQTHIYNFICEIPKWTRTKFEIATGETFNPIRQDTKNGTIRFYEHGDMMWNYGAFPQTWENPEYIPEDTKYPGDNDPLDVIELGTKQLPSGQYRLNIHKKGSVTAVKVLGILGLLDSGETDWKVLAINIKDPLANIMQDVHDIDKHMPGCIDAIRDWLRIYKVCTGAVENQYALRGEALNEEYTKKVIEEAHKQWQTLNEEGRREVKKGNIYMLFPFFYYYFLISQDITMNMEGHSSPILLGQKIQGFDVPELVGLTKSPFIYNPTKNRWESCNDEDILWAESQHRRESGVVYDEFTLATVVFGEDLSFNLVVTFQENLCFFFSLLLPLLLLLFIYSHSLSMEGFEEKKGGWEGGGKKKSIPHNKMRDGKQ
ncbi:acidocalcisomal pyrophosphatase, partial [Reticulomyxa filosa]